MKLVVELFSVLSGIAFVGSALWNGYSFHRDLRLNYFVLAQPSDVIMSAFAVYLELLSFLAIFGIMAVAMWPVVLMKRRIDRGLLPPLSEHTFGPLLYLVAGVLLLGAGIWATGWYTDRFTARTLAGVVESQLQLSADPAMTGDIYRRCGGAAVLWQGTGSVVLRCKERAVIVRSDELVLDQLPRLDWRYDKDAEGSPWQRPAQVVPKP